MSRIWIVLVTRRNQTLRNSLQHVKGEKPPQTFACCGQIYARLHVDWNYGDRGEAGS
jgi:hypothetical protein